MKQQSTSILSALVLSWFLQLPSLQAAGTSKRTFHPIILSISADSIKIKTGRNAGLKIRDAEGIRTDPSNIATYKLRPETTVTLDGLKSDVDCLRKGMTAQVTLSGDSQSAWTITAHTVPPPLPKKSKKEKKKENPKLFKKITDPEVIAISKDTITIGMRGGSKATAYYVASHTPVYREGKQVKFEDVSTGMKVRISAGSGNTAARIEVLE